MTGIGWSIEAAGQEPGSGIAAGSKIGPENTLKVETRVQIPLGLRRLRGISRVRVASVSAASRKMSVRRRRGRP